MSIWNELVFLLKHQFNLTKKDFLIKDDHKSNNSFWLSIVAFGFIALLLLRLSSSIFSGIRFLFETEEQWDAGLMPILETHILATTAVLVFFFLMLNGIRIVFENYFESRDVQILLTLPLSVQAIFASKFLQSFCINVVQIIPFIGTIWLGYGLAVGAGILYLPIILFVLICGGLIFTAVATILLLVIARFVPSVVMKQAITICSFAMAFIIFVGWQYFVQIAEVEITPEGILTISQNMQAYLELELPHLWMARSLMFPLAEFDVTIWESLIPLAVTAILGFLMSVFIAEKVFLTGWSKSMDVQAGSRGKFSRKNGGIFSRLINHLSLPAISPVVKKDLLLLKRTPFMWYNILIIVAMLGILAVNFPQEGQTHHPGIFNLEASLNLLLIGLFGTQAGGSVAGIAFSAEGKALWNLQTAPISKHRLYFWKLSFGLIINLAIMKIAYLIFYLIPNLTVYPWYLSLPLLFGKALVITSVILYLDIENPKFENGDKLNRIGGDNKIQGEIRSIVSVLIQLVTAAFLGLLVIIPGAFPIWWVITISLGIFVGTAVFVTRWCYLKSIDRLSNFLIG
ncbi:putative ABC transporter permease subunit [Natranaerobius thermophilus]|uniref:ABC-2 type transport system permease protein n=1 Tax=Natranaerobius thermophilus (strain ATCC BAA-1301 / DSM 18059 / JW/NM-WN-LF) TaxID=457570 RepID=B2A6N2_NATTJ|nr:hypothetical protein [Natranaerobius thermophilus]ACB84165.1 hypothetical protein Nther_0570 [Natranaerobius thermophilus JW/NM-WN-LF]